MKTLPNSMAYPLSTPNGRTDDGLSKREYFAAMCMQGLLANGHAVHVFDDARYAVKCADALITALNKPIDND